MKTLKRFWLILPLLFALSEAQAQNTNWYWGTNCGFTILNGGWHPNFAATPQDWTNDAHPNYFIDTNSGFCKIKTITNSSIVTLYTNANLDASVGAWGTWGTNLVRGIGGTNPPPTFTLNGPPSNPTTNIPGPVSGSGLRIDQLPGVIFDNGNGLIPIDQKTNTGWKTSYISRQNFLSSWVPAMPDNYRFQTASVLPPLGDMEWDSGAWEVFGANASQSRLGVYRYEGSNTWSIGQNTTPSQGFSAYNFYTPPGTTNVIVSGWFMCQTNAIQNITFVWLSQQAGGQAGSAFGVTNVWTNLSYSLPMNAAVSGGTNEFIIVKRDANTTTSYGLYVSNFCVTVQPTPTNLANPFYRYAITPDMLQNSGGLAQGYSNAVESAQFDCYGASGGSYIDLVTSETNLVLEVDNRYNGELTTPFQVIANGSTYNFLFPNQSPFIQVTNLILPPGLNSVRLVNQPAQTGALAPWRAVYTGTNSVIYFQRAKPIFKIAVIGDSIQMGFNATNQIANIWNEVAADLGCEIRNMSSGGTAVFHLSGMGMFTIQQQLASYQPNLVVFPIGINDEIHSYWASTNAFIVGYSNALLQIHDAVPATPILCLGPIIRNSDSLETNYIASEGLVISTSPISKYLQWVNTYNWLTLSDLADGTHPSDYGCAKYAYNLINMIITLNMAPY